MTPDEYNDRFFTVSENDEVGFHQSALEPYCDQPILPPSYDQIYEELHPDYTFDSFVQHLSVLGDSINHCYEKGEHQRSLIQYLSDLDTGLLTAMVPMGVAIGPYMLTPTGVKTYQEKMITMRGGVVNHDDGLGVRYAMVKAAESLQYTCEPEYLNSTLIITNRKKSWYESFEALGVKSYLKVSPKNKANFKNFSYCVATWTFIQNEYNRGPMREYLSESEYLDALGEWVASGQYVSMCGVKWRRIIVDVPMFNHKWFKWQNIWLLNCVGICSDLLVDSPDHMVVSSQNAALKLLPLMSHNVRFRNVEFDYNLIHISLEDTRYPCYDYHTVVDVCNVTESYRETLRKEKPTECLVCFKNFELLTECGHALCKRCAERLPECPSCRLDNPMYFNVVDTGGSFSKLLDCVKGRTVVWSSRRLWLTLENVEVIYKPPQKSMHHIDTLIYYGLSSRCIDQFVNMRRKKHLDIYVFS